MTDQPTNDQPWKGEPCECCHVPPLLTYEAAAELLATSPTTVRRLLQDGHLRPVRLTAQVVRVRADDLAALIERRTEDARDVDLPEPDRLIDGVGA